MIPITQEESFKIRELSPTTFITMVNKQHKSKDKSYYMTCEENALELLIDSNIYARQEMYEIWKNNYVEAIQRRNYKKADDINKKMKQIKELGM